MKRKLFDYVERDNLIYRLSGLTKIICFLLLTAAVMYSFDIRCVFGILLLSVILFRLSGIEFRQIRTMLVYVLGFLILNALLTFLFSPQYGVEIYGTSHVIWTITPRYVITQEQLLYQATKLLKYASVVPLGMLFLLTTNPSEFAASLNRIGLPYKAAYAFALTLRYFPDVIRDYQDISLAQQSRGLDLSRKEKFLVRAKNMMNICVPLIFSTLDRVELISNAMELRGFGKHKSRTWYAIRPLTAADLWSMLFILAVSLAVVAVGIFWNHSRFWNPFL